jgi:hypothetical protein
LLEELFAAVVKHGVFSKSEILGVAEDAFLLLFVCGLEDGPSDPRHSCSHPKWCQKEASSHLYRLNK